MGLDWKEAGMARHRSRDLNRQGSWAPAPGEAARTVGPATTAHLGFGADQPRSASCRALELEAIALISWHGISSFETQWLGCLRGL